MKKSAIVLLASILNLASEAVNLEGCLYDLLPTTSVVVRVCDVTLTKAEIEDEAHAFLQLTCNKQNRRRLDAYDRVFKNDMIISAPDRFVQKIAIQSFAAERGLAIKPEEIRKMRREYIKRYGRKGHRITDLRYMLRNRKYVLDAAITNAAMRKTVVEYIKANSHFDISTNTIASLREKAERIHFDSVATNQQAFAVATNVWRQVKAGLSFKEAADRHDQTEGGDGTHEWGVFSVSQFSDEPHVLRELLSIPVGQVTPPLESDGGLAILRKDSEEKDSQGNVTFGLSRIFFRLAEIKQASSCDEIVDRYKESVFDAIVDDTLLSVRQKLKVDYPQGTNLFSKATR